MAQQCIFACLIAFLVLCSRLKCFSTKLSSVVRYLSLDGSVSVEQPRARRLEAMQHSATVYEAPATTQGRHGRCCEGYR